MNCPEDSAVYIETNEPDIVLKDGLIGATLGVIQQGDLQTLLDLGQKYNKNSLQQESLGNIKRMTMWDTLGRIVQYRINELTGKSEL